MQLYAKQKKIFALQEIIKLCLNVAKKVYCKSVDVFVKISKPKSWKVQYESGMED